MKVKYTLCFVEEDGKYLMLNRIKSPNMGLWNGLGGKIEEGEEKFESVKREVLEESGLELVETTFHGEVYWHSEDFSGGLYVFTGKANKSMKTPQRREEGLLDWLPIEWVLDKNNMGIVSNIPIFMKELLEKKEKLKFDFYYDNYGSIKSYKFEKLKLD